MGRRCHVFTLVENLGERERLELVLDAISDESLMRKMERERVNGRLDVSFGFENHYAKSA